MTTIDRFLKFVSPEPNTGCWLWMGSTRGGYALFGFNHKVVSGHRFAYEHYIGSIPPGLQLDHLCRVRCCVNPSHLEIVTHKENIRRGETGSNMRTKTHCPFGHPYSGDNLYLRNGGRRRECRICRKKWQYVQNHKRS